MVEKSRLLIWWVNSPSWVRIPPLPQIFFCSEMVSRLTVNQLFQVRALVEEQNSPVVKWLSRLTVNQLFQVRVLVGEQIYWHIPAQPDKLENCSGTLKTWVRIPLCQQKNKIKIGLWCNGNILLLHGRDVKYNLGSSPSRPTKNKRFLSSVGLVALV